MVIEKALYNFKKFIPEGSGVLVACSGGVDSMLLSFVASKLKKRNIVVGHVSHNIRSKEDTLDDLELIRDYCAKIHLPLCHADLFIPRNGNLENNARKERYDALYRMAKSYGCSAIATAHHADDHFVSVLMHMCRGCGMNGLAGIRRRSVYKDILIVRPLLDFNKSDIYDVAMKKDIPFNYDITNNDCDLVRNDFNKNVLPILKKHYPRASENSLKMSERLHESLE